MDDEPDDVYGSESDSELGPQIVQNYGAPDFDIDQEPDQVQDHFNEKTMTYIYRRGIEEESFLLTDDEKSAIDDIRRFMKLLEDDLADEIVSESKFNENYKRLREKEINILLSSEASHRPDKGGEVDINEPMIDRLRGHEKHEMTYDKMTAKKHNITYPKLPKGISLDEINEYDNRKLKTLRLEDKGGPKEELDLTTKENRIENYLIELAVAQKKISQHQEGIIPRGPDAIEDFKKLYTTPQFKKQMPNSAARLIDGMKQASRPPISLISRKDKILQKISLSVRDKLENISREDLLKCIGEIDIKYMSYIEKLRNDKVPIDDPTESRGWTPFDPGVLPKTGEMGKLADIKLRKDLLIKGVKGEKPVWGLRGEVYSDFNKYLVALVIDLKTTKGKFDQDANKDEVSKLILSQRIEKIEFYIKTNKDPDLFLSDPFPNRQKLDKKDEAIEVMRENGLLKLMDIVSVQFPSAIQKGAQVENLESIIYENDPENYNYTIKRMLFIFYNEPNIIKEWVLGNLPVQALLLHETPKVVPENDISTRDVAGSIQTLLNWRPPTDDLTQNSKWDMSLIKYETLEIPNGFIRDNFRLHFLMRERNKLECRRIYTVAEIHERSLIQEELQRLFTDECKNNENPKELSKITETIIFNLSKFPEDYNYYAMIIKMTIKSLCEFLNVNDTLQKVDQMVLIPKITEFLISKGDIRTIDMKKVDAMIKMFSDEPFVQAYFTDLRENELNAYRASIISEINKSMSLRRIIRLAKSIDVRGNLITSRKNKELRELESNTYGPPSVFEQIPVEWGDGEDSMYSQKYTKIGNSYVVGGNYPDFYDFDGTSENYTREQLEHLAGVFRVNIIDNSKEMWDNIMVIINKSPDVEVVNDPIYNPTMVSDKKPFIPRSIIHYIYRPRKDVPSPGEIHEVVLSDEHKRPYAVPFKLENGLPVYNDKIKQLADDGFVHLEGPCKFESTDLPDSTVASSQSYILVEYLDEVSGSRKMFREGVFAKSIKHSDKENFDACNRFETEEHCNSGNSFAELVGKTRMKCKWKDTRCVSEAFDPNRAKFKLDDVKFRNPEIAKLWSTAREAALSYIEHEIQTLSATDEHIESLDYIQEDRLYIYKNELEQYEKELKTINLRNEDGDGHYFQVSKPGEYLRELLDRKREQVVPEPDISEYMEITLYKMELTRQKLARGRISSVQELTIVDYKAMISRKDYAVVTNPLTVYPGFYWNKESHLYIKDSGEAPSIVTNRPEITKETYLNKMLITPTGVLGVLPLVKLGDIMTTIHSMAFSTYKELEGERELERLIEFPATIDTKELALFKNKAPELVALSKRSEGIVTLTQFNKEVLNDYLPSALLAKQKINAELQKAIDKLDIKLINVWLRIARRHDISSNIVDEAKDIRKHGIDPVKDMPDQEPEPEPEPEQDPEQEPEPEQEVFAPTVYTSKSRRRGKSGW